MGPRHVGTLPYHRFERERIHLLLIDDSKRALADIAAGRSFEAEGALAKLQQRRFAQAASLQARKEEWLTCRSRSN